MKETKIIARNWTFLVYSDEARKDFLDVLQKLNVSGCCSQLHRPDEEDKKSHYHILITGEKKSNLQIYEEICKKLGDLVLNENGKEVVKGVTLPQKVLNLRAMVRYFCHLDQPKKQQFEEKKNFDFGGFYSERYFLDEENKKANTYQAIKEILTIVKEETIVNLFDLLEYLSSRNEDLFGVVCDNPYLVGQIVNASFRKNEKNLVKKALTA